MRNTLRRLLLPLVILLLASSVCLAYYDTDAKREKRLKRILSPDRINAARQELIDHGIDAESEERLVAALDHEFSYIRDVALDLLVYNKGKGSIPLIKKMVNDPSMAMATRIKAARYLGLLGNNEWHAQIRKAISDYDHFKTKYRTAKVDLKGLPGSTEKEKKKNLLWYKYRDALEAAKVLAKFGDRSGFQLAAAAAVKHSNPSFRVDGIEILGYMASANKDTLVAEDIDPELLLIAVAQTETEAVVLTVGVLGACNYLREDLVIRILDALLHNPHFPEDDRKGVTALLENLKAKASISIE